MSVLSALQKRPSRDAETLSKLLKHGCKMPDPAEVNVTDPRLLACLHEPQLLQRDEKEIEGYTLEVTPLLWDPAATPTPCLLFTQHITLVL